MTSMGRLKRAPSEFLMIQKYLPSSDFLESWEVDFSAKSFNVDDDDDGNDRNKNFVFLRFLEGENLVIERAPLERSIRRESLGGMSSPSNLHEVSNWVVDEDGTDEVVAVDDEGDDDNVEVPEQLRVIESPLWA